MADCTMKKFLCYFSLKTGATVVGIVMCLLMVVCTITSIVEMVVMDRSPMWGNRAWLNAYAMTAVACIQSIVMILLNLWMLWGVRKGIATVVLAWVMLTALWLGQSVALLLVLLILYIRMVSFAVWIICLVLALVAVGIFLYGILCVYSYWVELSKPRSENTVTN